MAAVSGAVACLVLYEPEAPHQEHAPNPPAPPPLPDLIPVPDAPLSPTELIATPSPGKVRMGQALPIRFHLRNSGNASVSVLPVLDGSEMGQRFPRCILSVADEGGSSVELPPMLGCGLYNRLAPRDFKRLEPGESVRLDIYALRWKPSAPGAYTITLSYDSSPLQTSLWHQEPSWMDLGVFRLLSQIPHVRLQTSVRVDVEP